MSETTALHTELLTIDEARELAGRRAQGHSLTLADRERLFAWVRDAVKQVAPDERSLAARGLSRMLGVTARQVVALCEAAGWPS